MLRRVITAMSVLVFAVCALAVVPAGAAPTAAEVHAFKVAYWTAAYNDWVANQPAPPDPISDRRCPDGQVKWLIGYTFGLSAPWAESVAMRESGCSPTAYNPSGASGVFQLLGHQDLLDAVCPPHGDWADPSCNIRAAWQLYLADGIAPWRL